MGMETWPNLEIRFDMNIIALEDSVSPSETRRTILVTLLSVTRSKAFWGLREPLVLVRVMDSELDPKPICITFRQLVLDPTRLGPTLVESTGTVPRGGFGYFGSSKSGSTGVPLRRISK